MSDSASSSGLGAGLRGVGAVVVEVGSTWTKAGWGGDDSPSCLTPSLLTRVPSTSTSGVAASSATSLSSPVLSSSSSSSSAVSSSKSPSSSAASSSSKASSTSNSYTNYVGEDALSLRRDEAEVVRVLRDEGDVGDWGALELLLEHIFTRRLAADPRHHPLLFVEPSHLTDLSPRLHLFELLFETFQIPALFLSNDAVLSCFSNSRTTALIVDCGGEHCSVTPVYEGYALKRRTVRSSLAGAKLADEFTHRLSLRDITIHPRYSIRRTHLPDGTIHVSSLHYPLTHPSYERLMIHNVAADAIASVCHVSATPFDEVANANIPTVPYELPDGKTIEIGVDRFDVTECLFRPEKLKDQSNLHGVPLVGVHKMVQEAIAGCDPNTRRDLWNNIICVGGTSLLSGFTQRLQTELTDIAPNKFKVLAPTNNSERRFSSWIGGSILASLSSFHHLWISKSEYADHGKDLIRKCP